MNKLEMNFLTDDKKEKDFNKQVWRKQIPKLPFSRIESNEKRDRISRIFKTVKYKKLGVARTWVGKTEWGVFHFKGNSTWIFCKPENLKYWGEFIKHHSWNDVCSCLLSKRSDNEDITNWRYIYMKFAIDGTDDTDLYFIREQYEMDFWEKYKLPGEKIHRIAHFAEFLLTTNGDRGYKRTAKSKKYIEQLQLRNYVKNLLLYILWIYGPRVRLKIEERAFGIRTSSFKKIYRLLTKNQNQDFHIQLKCCMCGEWHDFDFHHFVVNNGKSIFKTTDEKNIPLEPAFLIKYYDFVESGKIKFGHDVILHTIPACGNCHNIHKNHKYLTCDDYDKLAKRKKNWKPWGMRSKENFEYFFKVKPEFRGELTYEKYISDIKNEEKKFKSEHKFEKDSLEINQEKYKKNILRYYNVEKSE